LTWARNRSCHGFSRLVRVPPPST